MSTPTKDSAAGKRMDAVAAMADRLRLLFELEREFVRTAPTLIYRIGEPEVKFLICQHVWESAQHARFLRERGREMTGFGSGEVVREQIRDLFEEAVRAGDETEALAGFYHAIKPALLSRYRGYLAATEPLADWPTRQLLQEFVADEERHAAEMAPHLSQSSTVISWIEHLQQAVAEAGVDPGNGGAA